MSTIPSTSPNNFEFFAIIVDGEVAMIFPVEISLDMMIAAFSSNPTVIKLSEEDKLRVKEGWIYDGSEFNQA